VKALSKLATGEQYFDLNIEKVLEHWPVPFAIRELIANALDEHLITGTAEPEISKVDEDTWAIRDFGRGLRYQHLTQKENAEKRRHANVIGQFGMGLKDALAVFHRRGVTVEIQSPHSAITTVMRPKEGFRDIRTLHAAVAPPSHPGRTGTSIALRGVSDEDIDTAKRFFLKYSADELLEDTDYGQVLARPATGAANIYVKGLLVAQEENFLFSYNITSLTKALRQALNRERSNVGRTAYTDRVKAILKQSASAQVARPLADDLANFQTGGMHDELAWNEVTLHACRVLSTHEKVVFVSAGQLMFGGPQIDYAREEGYRLVLVPDDIAHRIGNLKDLDGRPMLDLGGYIDAWNDSFSFRFIDPSDLTPAETQMYALTETVTAASGVNLQRAGVHRIQISETMRLSDEGHLVVGVFEPQERRIVIRRDQLRDPVHYCGTLLHELTHAASGYTDGTLEFEEALTHQLGSIMVSLINTSSPAH
jgi:hypothetical protein